MDKTYIPVPVVDDYCPLCEHVQFWDGVDFIHNINGLIDCP